MAREDSLADQVKELWTAWQRGGLDLMLPKVPDDVEWVPVAGGGRTLRGSDEVRAYFTAQVSAGERQEATAFSYEQIGECVLVAGSLRQFGGHGWSDSQPVWVFFFEDGRLRRAVGYRTRREAEAAIDAYRS